MSSGRLFCRSRSAAFSFPQLILEELTVRRVAGTQCLLGSDESLQACDRNGDSFELECLGIRSGVRIAQTASPAEKVHDNFVRDTDDLVLADVVILELRGGVVGKNPESFLDSSDVFRRVVNQKIDILRGPDESVGYDGEAADQDVTRAMRVQRPADSLEIIELWRACVRAIIFIIHC